MNVKQHEEIINYINEQVIPGLIEIVENQFEDVYIKHIELPFDFRENVALHELAQKTAEFIYARNPNYIVNPYGHESPELTDYYLRHASNHTVVPVLWFRHYTTSPYSMQIYRNYTKQIDTLIKNLLPYMYYTYPNITNTFDMDLAEDFEQLVGQYYQTIHTQTDTKK